MNLVLLAIFSATILVQIHPANTNIIVSRAISQFEEWQKLDLIEGYHGVVSAATENINDSFSMAPTSVNDSLVYLKLDQNSNSVGSKKRLPDTKYKYTWLTLWKTAHGDWSLNKVGPIKNKLKKFTNLGKEFPDRFEHTWVWGWDIPNGHLIRSMDPEHPDIMLVKQWNVVVNQSGINTLRMFKKTAQNEHPYHFEAIRFVRIKDQRESQNPEKSQPEYQHQSVKAMLKLKSNGFKLYVEAMEGTIKYCDNKPKAFQLGPWTFAKNMSQELKCQANELATSIFKKYKKHPVVEQLKVEKFGKVERFREYADQETKFIMVYTYDNTFLFITARLRRFWGEARLLLCSIEKIRVADFDKMLTILVGICIDPRHNYFFAEWVAPIELTAFVGLVGAVQNNLRGAKQVIRGQLNPSEDIQPSLCIVAVKKFVNKRRIGILVQRTKEGVVLGYCWAAAVEIPSPKKQVKTQESKLYLNLEAVGGANLLSEDNMWDEISGYLHKLSSNAESQQNSQKKSPSPVSTRSIATPKY